MELTDITFDNNGVMFVAPEGVRMLSRCIASSEFSCTFKYFAALRVPSDNLKEIILDMINSKTEYDSSDKSIVMQTMTERDAYNGKISSDNVMAVGEIDMTNHVITSTADFTEVYIHLPNRFGSYNGHDDNKKVRLNVYDEIDLDVSGYPGSPESFKSFFYEGLDFAFNAIAIYVNISDGSESYNSLYGIYVPNRNADDIQKYAYAENGSITQSGNSFGFRINLRLVEDADNNGTASSVQTVIDEETNSFSMHMFTDALARMQMILAEHKELSEAFSAMYDDVENLKALCDTGTTLAELANRLAKLSEYVDNYMIAIEDKDSLVNMIASINRQVQAILNGEAGVELNIEIPLQAGDGIDIAKYGDAYVVNNASQRYHIENDSLFKSTNNARNFTPTTFSNIFPVYPKASASGTMTLSIDTSNVPKFRFKQGQSFQFVIASDYNWDGQKCIIKINDNDVGVFYPDKDIQCKKPIFEVICTSANNGSLEGGTYDQCTFWSRCINPKYEGSLSDDNLIPVTYDEAVTLRDKGSLMLDKIYYLTDYEFLPESGSNFVGINDDIHISIYMRPSDKTHFDKRVFMGFNTKKNGRYYSWGEYYLTREENEVDKSSRLKKGYITKLDYKTIEADFDFIHCAISKNDDINTKFRNTPAEFLQSLNGGDYDNWLTNDSIISSSPCSITSIDAINAVYTNSESFPAIDFSSCTNISFTSHNDGKFKLEVMHISNCEDVCIHDCDSVLLYGVKTSTFNNATDIMAKMSERLDVQSSDNLRIWSTYHSTFIHTFNSWVYKSENVSLHNVTGTLLDTHAGSAIHDITGSAIVILNYNTGTNANAMKAIVDNVNDGCVILDNNKILTFDHSSWRLICNKYDALATQRTSGSTEHEYYMMKHMHYMNDSMESVVQSESVQITKDNINDLI